MDGGIFIKISTFKDVRFKARSGPWATKSGGKLEVLVRFDFFGAMDFLNFYQNSGIRGLRLYIVKELPDGEVGGGEFHKVRQEILMVTQGEVLFIIEDLHGVKKEITLTPETGVLFIPIWILHTYVAKRPGSEILVLANTDFDPQDPATYDSYPKEEFHL